MNIEQYVECLISPCNNNSSDPGKYAVHRVTDHIINKTIPLFNIQYKIRTNDFVLERGTFYID